ncbi:MAG: signal peptidase [Candidatus Angelobacter sp.]|nr:signal peptidase [Candidatus Angelobacter sp.]
MAKVKEIESTTGEAPEKTKKQEKETVMEFVASMAVVLVTGLFIVTFNMQAFEIPSPSMVNTLLVGDHVFVDRITAAPATKWIKPIVPYGDIKRGDIVVFLSPETPGLHVVKRIIGIPGDRIHLRNGVVYRNGEKLDEPYVIRSLGNYAPYRDDFPAVPPELGSVAPEWHVTLRDYIKNGEIVVPPNSYFGMGDNRDVSYDSRYWGFIPQENVIGRPMFIYWSFDTGEGQYKKTAASERIAWLAHVAIHFFDETRWRRTLRLVH